MDTLSALVLVLIFAYGIYEFMSEGTEDTIARRLIQYSPAGFEKQKNTEQSLEYIKKLIDKIAKQAISTSKDVLGQKQILTEAGLSSDDDTFLSHMSRKVLYAIICGGVAFFVAIASGMPPLLKLVFMLLFPLMGFRFPDIQLRNVAKKRSEDVTYTLPDAIDLLSVCVEAGLGLDSALTRVAKEMDMSAPILAQEFKRVGKDVVAGISRSDALRALLKRNTSVELRSFVGLLIQSDKLGTSISQSLKVYADSLRTKRKQKAEELAAKASIKMTIPLVLFILPATFIVILAPAAISIYKTFTSSGMAHQ
jgi:tight adherence protein C